VIGYIYGGSGNDTVNVGNDIDRLGDISGIVAFHGRRVRTPERAQHGRYRGSDGQLTAIGVIGLGMGTNSW